MKSLICLSFWAFILCLGTPSLRAQDAQYICLPCGYACDDSVHQMPGVCSSCGMNLVDKRSIAFKNIDFGELCRRIEQNPGIVLLDVRSAEEFANSNPSLEAFGRFKGALNINVVDLESRVAELKLFKDREVVVYCSHSHRSPRASYYLSTHGFKNVKNVMGGVSKLNGINLVGCLKDQYIDFPPIK